MITLHTVDGGRLVSAGSDCSRLPEGLVWVDLHNPTKDEEKAVESMLGIQVPTQLEMAEIEESSRLYEEGGALVMTAVLIENATHKRPARTPVTFVLTKERLITVRYADPMPFRAFEAKRHKAPESYTTATLLFIALLDSIVERIADLIEVAETAVGDVSTRIFYDEEVKPNAEERSANLRNLLILLGRKNRMLAILRESLLSLNRLILFVRAGASFIKDGANGKLKAVERDIRSLAEYEARVEAEIAYLQDSTLGLINIEQNTIIKVFSIAAVLFLPPTLVGTIYGMNFEHMPELSWRVGYPLALVMMIVSAIIPFWWFKRKGWL
ncbi:magnesium transporter CorA family protein [Antarcticirhabdus aurantiaca]|uniref:Magnesium transporter CorA family protein n=1 Tax=Antarcticirhabdus aurantiaca TaxID=2606717 RepID=A0ACD4NHQ4_9HYPH|nr:magnesium transporter CorA family protein [Antarcticirhabdus aurantiaca]WAJ26311.1 magnesium transporter CorA family protein [Jeongeuplla avenae]